MKELLKKLSLTVASACLVAGGLVSTGWAGQNEAEKTQRIRAMSAPKAAETQAMPDEIEVNGQKYQKVRQVSGCGPIPQRCE